MSDPTSTRIRPLAALRAMRGLLRDREDTRQAFLLVEALRGKTTVRQFARFCETDGGRAYLDFVSEQNLSADGLVEASKIRATPPPANDLTWFRERNREMHDLLHVTGGYGRDPLGEACVLAFPFAQNRSKGAAVIAMIGAWRNLRRLKSLRAPRAVWEAYRQGRRALWLIGADWENLLVHTLATGCARFRVAPPTQYPQLRERSDAAVAAEAARLATA